MFVEFMGMKSMQNLDLRTQVVFHACLMKNIPPAVERIVEYAKLQLVPEHGYDTGLLQHTLEKVLITAAMDVGVIYKIDSLYAWYWAYMEDGFTMANGEYWPGYHYIRNAVDRQKGTLGRAVKKSWREAAAILSMQANAMQGVEKLL